MDLQEGVDVGGFHLGPRRRIEQRHLQHVMGVQYFLGHAQALGGKTHRGDAAALAVAAVVHLDGGLVDMACPGPGSRR